MSNQTKELYVRSLVFEAITQLLPTLGRDFTVAINFSDDNHIGIDIKDLTRMGKVVKDELMRDLQSTLTQLMNDVNNKEKQNGRNESIQGRISEERATATGGNTSGDGSKHPDGTPNTGPTTKSP